MLPRAGITNEEHLAWAQRLWRAKTSVLPPTDSSLIKLSITELLQLPAKRSTTAPSVCWQPMATASFPSSLCRRAVQNLWVDLTKTCQASVAEWTFISPNTEPRTQDSNYVAKMPVLMKICTEQSRQFCLLKIQSHCLQTAKWNGSAKLGEHQKHTERENRLHGGTIKCPTGTSTNLSQNLMRLPALNYSMWHTVHAGASQWIKTWLLTQPYWLNNKDDEVVRWAKSYKFYLPVITHHNKNEYNIYI